MPDVICPHCDEQFIVSFRPIGKKTECPECGKEFFAREDDEPLPRRRRKQSRQLWIMVGIVGGLFAFLFLLLVIVGILGLRKEQAKLNANARPIKLGEWVDISPILVRVTSACFGRLRGTSPSGEFIETSDVSLLVALEIKSTDGTKNHLIRGAHRDAQLWDTFGNKEGGKGLVTEFGLRCRINGQIEGEREIRSDENVSDLVAFPIPVPKATTLYLHIPAKCYGGSGELVFEFPEVGWKPEPDPPPDETLAFDPNDVMRSFRWMHQGYIRVDPVQGNQQRADLYKSLIGKNVRWPLPGQGDRKGSFTFERIELKGHVLALCSTRAGTDQIKRFIFHAAPGGDWFKSLNQKDKVVLVGTIKNVEHRGMMSGLEWTLIINPGQIEPFP